MPQRFDRDALIVKAKANCVRDPEKTLDREDLLEALIPLIEIDENLEKRRIAKAIVDAATRVGAHEPSGQIQFDFGEWDYEPDRLILGDNGRLVENDLAPSSYKLAETSRAGKHFREAGLQFERKSAESSAHAAWEIEQRKRGRTTKLTFGDFLRETDRFKPYRSTDAA